MLGDSFHALIRVSANTAAVTVHGVTRDASREGVEEARCPGGVSRAICATG